MSLPTLSTPTFELKIPSSGKVVTFRPFLVKEEKLLLMAKESKNPKEISTTVRKLIGNCVLDPLEFETLTPFDVEYMFLNFRSKSVGEEVELMVPCDSCETKNPVSINIDSDVFIHNQDKKIEFKIPLSTTVGMVMKFPSMEAFIKGSMDQDTPSLIMSSIESIYDDKTVHNVKDYTEKEVRDFISLLSMKDLQKVHAFFDEIPKVKCNVNFTCSNCAKENTLAIEGINNFF